MATEVEKKYRLTRGEAGAVRRRLEEIGSQAEGVGEDEGGAKFEENVIYTGPGLDPRRRVLRLRREAGRALLTFKEREPTASAIKRQREDETFGERREQSRGRCRPERAVRHQTWRM